MSTPSTSASRTLWVPSLGTACGIAEYTSWLAAVTGPVRVTANRPGPAGLRLLHVQHEYALFDEADLSACIRTAREHDVPTVVTEHSVIIEERPPGQEGTAWERVLYPVKRQWERDADVLVALTPTGTEILKRRWPGKRVVHIPHGCPTWFPPRKRDRGRVIGAFGFLAPYKGYWDLLDVLRELPGTELLLYSHPRWPVHEPDWIRASAGLPVRWVRQFLPEDRIATELAARADILVFWHHAGRFVSASGAVRVGLATGVPVLTSPIGRFDDVHEVTYQPRHLTDGVARLLADDALRDALIEGAREYCHANDWPDSGRRHLALWRELEAQHTGDS